MDYDERGLAAMPKLVGGSSYGRPQVIGVERTERPPHPDDLPLVSERTDEEHALARELGLDGSSDAFTAIAVGRPAPAVAPPLPYPNETLTGPTGDPKPRAPLRGFTSLLRRNGRSGAG